MPQKAWYKDWFNSPFYHQLYFDRDEKEAAAFINRLVQYLDPPPRSLMLDIACGKGRHSLMLANHGFRVTGIDISEESIVHAKQFEKDNLEFFRHDMRLPLRVNYYDYAFNFFTSFGYFNTQREHDDTMRTIAGALKPGGTLVIDYLNVHFAEARLIHTEEKTMNGTHYELRRWHDESHFFKKIIIRDQQLSQPMEFTEQVAKFSLGDFTDMFSYQGLQMQQVFGDYHLAPYHLYDSPRLIMIAKKQDR